MSETNWYVVHTYSGYENKVKANIEKTIENRHLEDQILEVRVPMQDLSLIHILDCRPGHWQIGLCKFFAAAIRLPVPDELSAPPGDIDQEVMVEVIDLKHLCPV